MTLRAPVLPFLVLAAAAGAVRAQTESGETMAPVRVTVSMNQDGSRTAYEFDSANHKALATTTDASGKLMGKIRYELDDAGRFAKGRVFGADNRLRFKSIYKYDPAGRLAEETQLTQEDAVKMKLVYSYDANGKQTGYSVYDAAGKLLGQTTPKVPSSPGAAAAPAKKTGR